MDEVKIKYDDIGRIYCIHGVNCYSVTTALGHTADKSFLDRWKAVTPNHEQIARQAAKLGTDFHLLGEKYLLGEPEPDVQWFAKRMFEFIKPKLSSITQVVSTETFLYDLGIKIAGRTDAIVFWKDKLAILDFKCLNYTNPAWMIDYFLQMCIYSYLCYIMSGERPKKIVLVCANKKTGQGVVFEDNPDKYAKEAAKRIQDFHKKVLTGK